METILQNLEQRGGKGDDQSAKVLHSMKTIAKTAFLSGIRKKDIVQKRKNHTQSKMAKSIPQPNQIKDEDSDSEEEVKKQEGKKEDENIEKKLKDADAEKERLKKEIEKNLEANMCVICEENQIGIVYVPCGHQIVCVDCSKQQEDKGIHVCPTCRANVTMRVKTFGR